jgi:hypothetical protein
VPAESVHYHADNHAVGADRGPGAGEEGGGYKLGVEVRGGGVGVYKL